MRSADSLPPVKRNGLRALAFVGTALACCASSITQTQLTVQQEMYGRLANVPAPVSSNLAPPVITYSGAALASPQTFYAVASAGSPPDTTHFGYFGAATVGQLFSTSIRLRDVVNVNGTAANPKFWMNSFYSGSGFDLIHAPGGQSYDIWIDGTYMGHFAPFYNAGTATAGTTNTITLAVGASASNGFYNQNYVTITGGTGAGQVRQIASYVGATLTATVSANWTTPPDVTSTYTVAGDPGKYCASGNACTAIDASGASDKFINFSFAGIPAQHLIQIATTEFGGFNIGQTDSLIPAIPTSSMRAVILGDSFIAGTASVLANPTMSTVLAQTLGLQEFNQGYGGTGWCNQGSLGGLDFADRIAPPAESWQYSFNTASGSGATGGTYTISVTNGTTQTTGAIAWNAVSGTIQTAIQGLSNLPANSVSVGGQSASVASNILTPFLVVLHGVPGASLTVNTGGLTGTPVLSFSTWPGVVAPDVPALNGTALPFLLYVQGSGNDSSFTPTQVQACVTQASQAISTRFPTAITIFTGVVDSSGSSISSSDLLQNAAISAGAALLPRIYGQTPFIDTYSAGLGGKRWINGASTVANPTNGTNDIMKGTIITSHPTGDGGQYLGQHVVPPLKALFGVR